MKKVTLYLEDNNPILLFLTSLKDIQIESFDSDVSNIDTKKSLDMIEIDNRVEVDTYPIFSKFDSIFNKSSVVKKVLYNHLKMIFPTDEQYIKCDNIGQTLLIQDKTFRLVK